jgi:hypothetical protein
MANQAQINVNQGTVTDQGPDNIKVTDSLRQINKVRVTAVDVHGNRFDLSIDGREQGLYKRTLHGVGATSLVDEQHGKFSLNVHRNERFNGHIEIVTSNGSRKILSGQLKMPDATEARKSRGRPPEVEEEKIDFKIEFEGVTAKPVGSSTSPDLFRLLKQASGSGAEVVVVPGEKEKFAYEIRRGVQVASRIEVPSGGNDFHSRRDDALAEELSKLLTEPKATIHYKGRDIEFSRVQSPELYEQCKRLESSGMQMTIIPDGDEHCKIAVKDQATGYISQAKLTMSYEDVKAVARGQQSMSKSFHDLIAPISERSDLLISNDGSVSNTYHERVAELGRKIPGAMLDQLLEQNWKITLREIISPSGRYASSELNERTPVGRCSYEKKEIELAEFSLRDGKRQNDPVHAIYHEVGHVFCEGLSDDKKMRLEMALERDRNQLGDIGQYTDPGDRDLQLKLQYYGNVREGVPESVEALIDPASNGARIMPAYYPNLYAATKRILEESGVDVQ